ncbi:hypothetical protein [Erwinia sp. CGal63]|uniref:hypothetical protein n=1 Tax=Erwinia sp. CGal63 TaxID=2919889 RepID=UPI0030086068
MSQAFCSLCLWQHSDWSFNSSGYHHSDLCRLAVGHAKQRNLSVVTELRLMKLAFRMRKIIKVRAREEKAKIKAEKKHKRGK